MASDHKHFEDHPMTGELIEGQAKLIQLKSNKLSVEVVTRNFGKSDKIKLYKAIEILEVVMNSEEFKQRILSYKSFGKIQIDSRNLANNNNTFRPC